MELGIRRVETLVHNGTDIVGERRIRTAVQDHFRDRALPVGSFSPGFEIHRFRQAIEFVLVNPDRRSINDDGKPAPVRGGGRYSCRGDCRGAEREMRQQGKERPSQRGLRARQFPFPIPNSTPAKLPQRKSDPTGPQGLRGPVRSAIPTQPTY